METQLVLRPLEPDDWPHLVRLFGGNGACGGCWCMWWRVPRGGKLWEAAKGQKNRDSFRRLVKARKVHGVLAFLGEEPVGWCAFGPRGDFPRLETVKALRHAVDRHGAGARACSNQTTALQRTRPGHFRFDVILHRQTLR